MKNTRLYIIIPLIITTLIILFTLFLGREELLRMIERITGLFAYYFIFLAILSYEYMVSI